MSRTSLLWLAHFSFHADSEGRTTGLAVSWQEWLKGKGTGRLLDSGLGGKKQVSDSISATAPGLHVTCAAGTV